MESKNFCIEKFLEEYNTFLNEIEKLFSDDEDNLVTKFINECESDKLSRGKSFYDSLENDELFDLFCKSKVKLFSSKDESTNSVSNSIFGEELPIKKLINNQLQKTKNVIWKYLHLFYFLLESGNKNRSSRKSKLSKLLKENEEKVQKDVKNDLLNVEVNEETNNMIDDIVKSFESTLNDDNSDNKNPFESIMNITQLITEKYSDKIESGEIELEKLMGSIQGNIPGMPDLMGGMKGMESKKVKKEKVVIDENFSTDQVDVDEQKDNGSGMNLSNMLKMMNSMNGNTGSGDIPNMGGLFSMLNGLNDIKTEEDAEKLKKQMDSYLEKELGVNVGELNKKIEEAHDNIVIKDNGESNSDSDNEANLD